MPRFIKSQSNYISINDIESVQEHTHLEAPIVHVTTTSGRCHQMPPGIPAAFIVELLIQGNTLDVQKEFELYTGDL